MRTLLVLAALAAFVVAAALGFGHFPEHAEDTFGWLAGGLALLTVTHLPLERLR